MVDMLGRVIYGFPFFKQARTVETNADLSLAR
jgi:hypothetical protein